jgi:tetratricopeptide (TPR) repeat protein
MHACPEPYSIWRTELFKSLNDYAHAEPPLLKSLELRQKLLAADSGEVAQSKNDLGEVYTATGAFDKAEPLLLEALVIRRKAGETAEVAQSLEALGTLYGRTGRAQQAEQSFREAVSIFGKTVGGKHPDYANALEDLALYCQSRHDFATAEPLLDRVLEIRKTVFGPEHRDVATSLDTLAALKRAEHKPQEAAASYEQALLLWEKILGPDSPDLAADLNNLGAIYEFSREKERAEPLFLRAIALDEKALGPGEQTSIIWAFCMSSASGTGRHNRFISGPWRSALRRWGRPTPR